MFGMNFIGFILRLMVDILVLNLAILGMRAVLKTTKELIERIPDLLDAVEEKIREKRVRG